MNRRDEFRFMVQSYLLLNGRQEWATFVAASELMEEEIPEHTALAAQSFCEFRFGLGPQPEWLKEVMENREAKKNLVRVTMNKDGSLQWWKLSRELGLDPLARKIWDHGFVTVNRDVAEALLDWAKGIPGYGEGPPFLVEELSVGNSTQTEKAV